MTLDSMSESCLYQLERYFNSNPYREYAMNKPYVPVSGRSNRVNKSSSIVFNQLINNEKKPSTLDRNIYKLRIKSDLNVDPSRHSYLHTNSPMNDTLNFIPRPVTTKTSLRQPTATTRITKSTKPLNNENFNGIEGNSVHVGTLDDLINQFHREEIRLIQHPIDYLGNVSSHTINERLPSFSSARTIKQPQALTEYHLKVPISPRTASQGNRYRLKEKRNKNPNQYLSKRQLTTINSHDKQIQESHEKTLFHTEKQLCICNKLTIIDPFNSEQTRPILRSTKYIFPAIRPIGYFTRRSIDNTQNSTSLFIRKKSDKKKLSKYSFDLIDQLSRTADETSQVFNDINNKSLTTLSDLNDDYETPQNTTVNLDFKP